MRRIKISRLPVCCVNFSPPLPRRKCPSQTNAKSASRLSCRRLDLSGGRPETQPHGPRRQEMTSTDHVQWMEGKFFLVLHSNFKGCDGHGTALAVMGYDPDKKVYTYNEYNSMGQITHSEGTVSGDTGAGSATTARWPELQRPVHHEGPLADFVYVQVRNVAGRHHVDDGYGRQVHEEVAVHTDPEAVRYRLSSTAPVRPQPQKCVVTATANQARQVSAPKL